MNHTSRRQRPSQAGNALLVSLFLLPFAAQVLSTPPAPTAAPLSAGGGGVVINEIAWMGTVASTRDEWIEFYNASTGPVDLAGWTLTAADGSPDVALSGTVPAGGHFLLEVTDDDSVPGVAADLVYSGNLKNSGEDLLLRNDDAEVVDRVDCSAGWFAGQADGAVPMVRVSAGHEGSQASSWTHSPRCGTATNAAGASHACLLDQTSAGQALRYEVTFNQRAATATATTEEQTPMEEALLALIEDASTGIDIALYGLNRQSVIDALIAAHQGGLTVRVVGDDEADLGDYSVGYHALRQAGITVVTDDSTSKIQHNKFVIVDGETVWTGSTNFTDTGLTLNANNSIAIDDPTLAAIYTTEFEEMWGGQFHDHKADNTAHLLDYEGTLVESYFSPTDLVSFEVWDELAHADESVHFAMFFWTDDFLTNALIERMENGVEVYGVWDRLGAASPTSADEALADAGAEIRVEDFLGKVHHKFAVIDVEGDDPVVILGSYNWTGSGAYDNDENTLIIHDADLAQAYYEEWHRLWWALGP